MKKRRRNSSATLVAALVAAGVIQGMSVPVFAQGDAVAYPGELAVPEIVETRCSCTFTLTDIVPEKVVLELRGATFLPADWLLNLHSRVCPAVPWPAGALCALFVPRPGYRVLRSFRASRLVALGGGEFALNFRCRRGAERPGVRIRVRGRHTNTGHVVWYHTPGWRDLAGSNGAPLSPVQGFKATPGPATGDRNLSGPAE